MISLLFALTVGVKPVTRAEYLMGTVCEITAADPEPAFAEARRIEALISTWRDDSELSRLNHGEITKPSSELDAMLREAMAISRETDGAFDPTVGRYTLPRRGATGLIDEGGFGKGYALDRMLAATRGDVVINFGGQIAVRGAIDVAIAHPLHRDRPVITLPLRDASLSTSSDSEHPGHIVNPATGQSVRWRGSVSVIDRSAFRADALSTALFVMGPQRGLAWARAHNVVAIFIDDLGDVTWSRKP